MKKDKLVLVSSRKCGVCFTLLNILSRAGYKVDIKDSSVESAFIKKHKIIHIPVLLAFDENGFTTAIHGSKEIFEAIKQNQ